MKRVTAALAIGLALSFLTACSAFLNQNDMNTAANGNPSSNGSGGDGTSVVADSTAPVVSITSPVNGQEIASNATIYGTCSDNIGVASVTVYYYTNNGAETPIPALVTGSNFTALLPGIAFGNYIIYAKAKDGAANFGNSPNVSLVIAAVPSVDFTSPVSNGLMFITNNTLVPFGGTAAVSSSTISSVFLINSALGAVTTNTASLGAGTWSYTKNLTANTINFLSLYAVAANNKTNMVNNSIQVLVDTDKPIAQITTQLSAYTNSSSVTFGINALDTLSGLIKLFYTLNGATNLLATNSISATVNGLSQMNNNIGLTAQDAAGNVTSTNVSVYADWTSPTASFGTLPSLTNASSFGVPVNIADGHSGILTSYFKTNAGAPSSFGGASFNTGTLPDGSNALAFWTKDNAGNLSATQSMIMFVDTAPPTATMSLPALTNLTGVGIWVSTTASDTPYNINFTKYYTIDGGATNILASPSFQLPSFSGGSTHSIKFWVKDAAGNITSVTKSITIETTPPTISTNLFTPDISSVQYGDSVHIEGTAGDANGIASVTAEEHGTWGLGTLASSGTANWTVDMPNLINGHYTVDITAYDNAGNFSAITVEFDIN